MAKSRHIHDSVGGNGQRGEEEITNTREDQLPDRMQPSSGAAATLCLESQPSLRDQETMKDKMSDTTEDLP